MVCLMSIASFLCDFKTLVISFKGMLFLIKDALFVVVVGKTTGAIIGIVIGALITAVVVICGLYGIYR